MICAALVVITGIVIRISPAPHFDDTWAESLALPAQLPPFAASLPLFCTNMLCLATFSSENAAQGAPCAECGERLATRTLGELRVLPNDTRMWKMRYTRDDQESYFTSLVVSGVEKDSIHRPEICLIAQGYAITHERVVNFELPTGLTVAVKILDLKKGGTTAHPSTYAYWFFQDRRQTPYHARRVWASTMDGILRNSWTPWAYIAVHTHGTQNPTLREARLMDFLQKLYREIDRDLQSASTQ